MEAVRRRLSPAASSTSRWANAGRRALGAVTGLALAAALGGCDDARSGTATGTPSASASPATTAPAATVAATPPRPVPTPLATREGGPTSIALDDETVYWLEDEAGMVVRAPRAGGAAEAIATNQRLAGIRHAPALVVDDANVFFVVNVTAGELLDGGIGRVAKKGGPVTQIVKGRNRATALAQLGGALFWAESDGIFRGDKASGATTRIAGAEDLRSPCAIAIDKTHVYWIETQGNDGPPPAIRKATHAGRGEKIVATNDAGFACSLALDDTSVLWIDLRAGAVMRTPKDGGAAATVGAVPVVGHALVADASSVYVLSERSAESFTQGTLWRLPAAGGSAFLIATDEVPLNGLATEGKDVFWTGARPNDHHGFVRRLSK